MFAANEAEIRRFGVFCNI